MNERQTYVPHEELEVSLTPYEPQYSEDLSPSNELFVTKEDLENEKYHDECAVIAVYDPGNQARAFTKSLLKELYNRGEHGTGVASLNGEGKVYREYHLGSPRDAYQKLGNKNGKFAIGHNRYATQGEESKLNLQPFYLHKNEQFLSLAHNGNLLNTEELKKEIHHLPMGTSDSALAAEYIFEKEGDSWKKKITNALPNLIGAYSFTMLTDEGIFAARDPLGIRPLWIGSKEEKGKMVHVIASESIPLEKREFNFEPVKPGELVHIDLNGHLTREQVQDSTKTALCVFEYIYFSHKGSRTESNEVIEYVRERLGRELARKEPLLDDIRANPDDYLIGSVPTSGTPAAKSYANELGVPFNEVLEAIKRKPLEKNTQGENKDTSTDDAPVRTFMGHAKGREKLAHEKFGIIEEMKDKIKGKKIVVVDDSIVRGTVGRRIKEILMDVGALEVHIRSTCPPVFNPCRLGVATHLKQELAANKYIDEDGVFNVKKMAERLGLTSVGFLTIPEMFKGIFERDIDLNELINQEKMVKEADTVYCYECLTDRLQQFPEYTSHSPQQVAVLVGN